jgi:hypothetical protein
MRHLPSGSHFFHALYALQDADGYVDALMGKAREHALSRPPGQAKAATLRFTTPGARCPTAPKPVKWH